MRKRSTVSVGLVVELVDQNDVQDHPLNGFPYVGCLGDLSGVVRSSMVPGASHLGWR